MTLGDRPKNSRIRVKHQFFELEFTQHVMVSLCFWAEDTILKLVVNAINIFIFSGWLNNENELKIATTKIEPNRLLQITDYMLGLGTGL